MSKITRTVFTILLLYSLPAQAHGGPYEYCVAKDYNKTPPNESSIYNLDNKYKFKFLSKINKFIIAKKWTFCNRHSSNQLCDTIILSDSKTIPIIEVYNIYSSADNRAYLPAVVVRESIYDKYGLVLDLIKSNGELYIVPIKDEVQSLRAKATFERCN